ncbi:hypothetical protein [Streptomyces asoensis]|uniref:Lipoprotein n=1 Tax=Streptomyces asoensis TaxID=249586 RepID=A0ABQ3RYV7_9ACTN|nr:hypothetical protein [Streptomyces asoensis]GGQ48638.1 hypothetical protein GCM10010496_08630 [Streptomyces asoensis]GHI61055.1 hypothetical protein Saso_27050 [Streptomyces asoensis]
MTRLTGALAAAYTVAAAFLAYCAQTSWQHDSPGYALGLHACALLAVLPPVRWLNALLLAADQRAEEALVPIPDPAPMPDDGGAVLGRGCCELWWATAGADHDPATCTRKDQTT